MTESRSGRIVTFYSYKGGTGRSMALANVAWILASAGNRVLAVDWDLEAPGLHRYLHPFLTDPDLSHTEGLIDALLEFCSAAAAEDTTAHSSDEDWFLPYADLSRFAVPIDYVFPMIDGRRGLLEVLPAGKQSPQYAARVSRFDWDRFYTTFSGGIFLEAVKTQLRENYDYVLIDSRTGVSDTAGICTVQMPDDLVVLFTLNRQSLSGAVAVARSAVAQRTKSLGQRQGLKIWPVPTRVEDAEKRWRDRMQQRAMTAFDDLVLQIPRTERERYWGEVAIRYEPFYAYEEVLAVFGDRPHTTGSMLGALEAITRHLTGGRVTSLTQLPETERQTVLGRYGSTDGDDMGEAEGGFQPASDGRTVFVCVSAEDARDASFRKFITDLNHELKLSTGGEISLWHATNQIDAGTNWVDSIGSAIKRCAAMLVLVSPHLLRSAFADREISMARLAGLSLLPVDWIPPGPGSPSIGALKDLSSFGPASGGGVRRAMLLADSAAERWTISSRLAKAIIDCVHNSRIGQVDQALESARLLARRYEELHEDIPAGPARPRSLDRLVAEMRVAGRSAGHLLQELCYSASSGERLAAIAILQGAPQAAFLPWLAERIGTGSEAPFVDYHAAVALRAAATLLPHEDLRSVEKALELALGSSAARPDEARDMVLRLTHRDLESRSPSFAEAFRLAFVTVADGIARDTALQAYGNLRRMAEAS